MKRTFSYYHIHLTTNSLNSKMTYMLYLKNRNGYRHVLGTKISAIPNFIFNFNIFIGFHFDLVNNCFTLFTYHVSP